MSAGLVVVLVSVAALAICGLSTAAAKRSAVNARRWAWLASDDLMRVNRLARSAASALRRADCAAVRSQVRDFQDRVADQIDTASATSATATAAHSASDHLITSAYETSAVTR